jgi:uncharacterized membrane protein HdeD (DUF308 family)
MSARLGAWFRRTVLGRRWLTFIVLGLAFFAFGSGSLNLFFLLKANADLITMHGWQAVMDGALQQTVELLITGYLSVAAYVVFKACEHALVHALVVAPTNTSLPQPVSDHEDRSTPR